MMRNKKLRTVFCGILIFLLVFALFCLGDYGIRYYHTPIKKDYDYTGTGMLVSLTEPDTFEQVSVEIPRESLTLSLGESGRRHSGKCLDERREAFRGRCG